MGDLSTSTAMDSIRWSRNVALGQRESTLGDSTPRSAQLWGWDLAQHCLAVRGVRESSRLDWICFLQSPVVSLGVC